MCLCFTNLNKPTKPTNALPKSFHADLDRGYIFEIKIQKCQQLGTNQSHDIIIFFSLFWTSDDPKHTKYISLLTSSSEVPEKVLGSVSRHNQDNVRGPICLHCGLRPMPGGWSPTKSCPEGSTPKFSMRLPSSSLSILFVYQRYSLFSKNVDPLVKAPVCLRARKGEMATFFFGL